MLEWLLIRRLDTRKDYITYEHYDPKYHQKPCSPSIYLVTYEVFAACRVACLVPEVSCVAVELNDVIGWLHCAAHENCKRHYVQHKSLQLTPHFYLAGKVESVAAVLVHIEDGGDDPEDADDSGGDGDAQQAVVLLPERLRVVLHKSSIEVAPVFGLDGPGGVGFFHDNGFADGVLFAVRVFLEVHLLSLFVREVEADRRHVQEGEDLRVRKAYQHQDVEENPAAFQAPVRLPVLSFIGIRTTFLIKG